MDFLSDSPTIGAPDSAVSAVTSCDKSLPKSSSSMLLPLSKTPSEGSVSTTADAANNASCGSLNIDSAAAFDLDPASCRTPKNSELLTASEYLKTSLQDLEDNISSISTVDDNATKSPSLSLPLADVSPPELSFFADEESLTDSVRGLLDSPKDRRLMLAIHARLASSPPSTGSSISSATPVGCAVCVAIMRTEEEAGYLCMPGRLGSRITVTSFSNPILPGSNDLVSIPGSKDLMQIDEICELPDGTPSICGVMALGDVKMLLPQDETECQARVLMVKRCHKLGARCSLKLKAYFDTVLGHDGAVEHVLMLPLKARCTARRGVPPKTGFVVFRNPADSLLARALGSEQVVEPEASIKVETFDGM
ncbi:hypothetical protein FOZ61_010876 [Perkinsus olseni]|uniref:Uncharacterized protein n=1 Tax=Perkinsus olseni TaxID=32597 RepID=A0A7J6M1T8_PEROL|nr:hypothetical protein FOZ61_010876 [Perkinsus olseni]